MSACKICGEPAVNDVINLCETHYKKILKEPKRLKEEVLDDIDVPFLALDLNLEVYSLNEKALNVVNATFDQALSFNFKEKVYLKNENIKKILERILDGENIDASVECHCGGQDIKLDITGKLKYDLILIQVNQFKNLKLSDDESSALEA